MPTQLLQIAFFVGAAILLGGIFGLFASIIGRNKNADFKPALGMSIFAVCIGIATTVACWHSVSHVL